MTQRRKRLRVALTLAAVACIGGVFVLYRSGGALDPALAGRGAADGRQRQGGQDQDQTGTEQHRQGLPAPAVGEMRRSAGRPAQSQQTPRDSAI